MCIFIEQFCVSLSVWNNRKIEKFSLGGTDHQTLKMYLEQTTHVFLHLALLRLL